jgi:tetratricopeptide (TPR) repeat protein
MSQFGFVPAVGWGRQEYAMKLSAVLIARNEEAVIGRALASLRGFDEIVVLDTGSSDRTMAIAEALGARVEGGFAWSDDFAAARNDAAARARGEWILSVDCDWECLTHGDVVRAEIGRLARLGAEAGLCRAVNGPGSEHWMSVLWKRGRAHWVGPVHECLSVNSGLKTAIDFRIGQSPAKAKDRLRNIRILRKSDLRRPRHQFYLGRELYERGQFAEAIAWLTIYLRNGQFLAEVAEAQLTIARCHWQLGQGDQARQVCLRAITCNPDFAEALRFMAEMHNEPWQAKWRRLAAAATSEDVLFLRSA